MNLPEYLVEQPDPITRDELIRARQMNLDDRRAFIGARLPDLMRLTSLTIGKHTDDVGVVCMDAQSFHRLIALLIIGGYLDNLDFERVVSAITD